MPTPAEPISDVAFIMERDPGVPGTRFYGFLSALPDIVATGKTRQHVAWNLKVKLLKYEREHADPR